MTGRLKDGSMGQRDDEMMGIRDNGALWGPADRTGCDYDIMGR